VEDLPDDALVVRGGLLADLTVLREQAEDAHLGGEGFGLSVWADAVAPGESNRDTIARLARIGRILNPKLRVTTAGALREAGLTLMQVGKNPEHYNVMLGDELTDDAIEAFRSAFGPPMEKPT